MTNKEYIKAIEMRTSRRTYKPRALDKSIVEVLKNMVDAVNEASGLEFQFIEDGNPPFKIFTGKFSYIAVTESKYFNGHTNIIDDTFLCFGVKGLLANLSNEFCDKYKNEFG